jgi:hypothetical protein
LSKSETGPESRHEQGASTDRRSIDLPYRVLDDHGLVLAWFLQFDSLVGSVSRDLKCRLERSGHSRVVIFHRDDGEEIFVLPAERLDPVTLQKLEQQEVRCAVDAPGGDGTSALCVRSLGGETLYQQRVWIRSGTWARMVREG